MDCPKCHEDRAHRSHRHGLRERIASLVGYYPYRCRQCGHRFLRFRYAEPKVKSGTEKEIRATRASLKWRHKKQEIWLYALGFLIFLAFLYYLTLPRMPTGG